MRTPGFWSKDTLLSRLLVPSGMAYAAATRRRLSKGFSYRAPVPVICVGNVTAGGSGKTPTVQALAKRANERGIAVQCLTRGYGGRIIGPVLVNPAVHTAYDVGDEALLLAEISPTWVARDRAAGAQAAVASGAQLLILDDGLQNPDLAYDLSLLVIDGGFGFGNGRIIPAGPLREPINIATARVKAAIIIGNDTALVWGRLPPALPVISARIVPRDNTLADKRIVAFAGIGRPDKFRETLTKVGAMIVGWFPFPDHHNYTTSDLQSLDDAAKAADGVLVTTEKDFVRLPLSYRSKVVVLNIDLVTEDPAAWDKLLGQVLK